MRILVISDSHGRNDDVKGVLEQVGEIDMLIHCGDVERGDQYIRDIAGCPVVIVAGNNDYYLDLPSEETIEVEGYRIWVTHGHPYYVSLDSEYIREEGAARKVDIVMFGHTHKPYFEQKDGITVLNPGSLAYPRQEGRKGSYMIMEIDQEGKAHFNQKYLD